MFLWFNEPKLDSASLCALRTVQAPGAISRGLLAAEYNPLIWLIRFKGHNFGSSLVRRRFCKLISVIPQFKQKFYYKSNELLFYLKAIGRGIKALCYSRSPAVMKLTSSTRAAQGPSVCTTHHFRNPRLHFRNQCILFKHQLRTKNDHRLNTTVWNRLWRASSDNLISRTG